MRPGGRLRTGLLLAGSLTLIVTATTSTAVAQDPWEVVASGLDNPRHVTFSPNGDLFVAEAGRGGSLACADHPLGEFCLGFSGAVTRVRRDGSQERVLTGLPSIFNAGNAEALGPFDIAFTGAQKYTVSVGIGGSDEFREALGDDAALLGTLVSARVGADEYSLYADVLANEAAVNPDGRFIDSNPAGLWRHGGSFVIADAGANAVVRVSPQGAFDTIAVLPQGLALAPPFLGLPAGTQIPTDAVPTSVVRGPDGAYYITQLTGFPFEKGDANIWRVVPGEQPTVYASGLTNLTDLAFARDGSLYAVEIATDGLLVGPIGSLVKVTPGSSEHETIAGGLFAPYSVALRGDAAYVSTCAVCLGTGEVIKIPLD